MTAVTEFQGYCRNKSDMAQAAGIDAAALFEAHYDRIYRYVLRMVHDPAEAEDLTQETFLRAHRAGDSLRDPQAGQNITTSVERVG